MNGNLVGEDGPEPKICRHLGRSATQNCGEVGKCIRGAWRLSCPDGVHGITLPRRDTTCDPCWCLKSTSLCSTPNRKREQGCQLDASRSPGGRIDGRVEYLLDPRSPLRVTPSEWERAEPQIRSSEAPAQRPSEPRQELLESLHRERTACPLGSRMGTTQSTQVVERYP